MVLSLTSGYIAKHSRSIDW